MASLSHSRRCGPPAGHTIEWPKSSFNAENIEYLCHILTKGVDSFTTDKGVFINHAHKRNVDKNCFEVLERPRIKKWIFSSITNKQYSYRCECVKNHKQKKSLLSWNRLPLSFFSFWRNSEIVTGLSVAYLGAPTKDVRYKSEFLVSLLMLFSFVQFPPTRPSMPLFLVKNACSFIQHFFQKLSLFF